MADQIKIKSALISVYHKQGLDAVVEKLIKHEAVIYSTGGTAEYMRSLGATVVDVSDLTGYPSILGGRVKTLHPKVHGGILARREHESDQAELSQYEIPEMDLVVVDLYPFEETVASGASEADIIEKIDIGGIALIRAAAKNFQYVCCVPSAEYYTELAEMLASGEGSLSLAQRRYFAGAAFDVSSHYDTHIHAYLAPESDSLKVSVRNPQTLRYGENPHQEARFYGKLEEELLQIHGKPLSYNNLVDIEGALQLVDEFTDEPFFAVIKHTNPCGAATGTNLLEAWKRALAGDPVSAFGGILACNGIVEADVAAEMDKLFFEVLIAKDFTPEALEILQKKKKRILLKRVANHQPSHIVKTVVNGFLMQDKDQKKISEADFAVKSSRQPTAAEKADIIFGDTVCKHLKSNAIGIVKNGQLIGSGMGQTSRIDALKHAILKAEEKGFDLQGSVLASDAFFPFADSVELAHSKGISIVVQPGGSIRDEETINFCETHDMCLIFTGVRHFKH
ncbi:MAG: bifunctional phosphoribosylaminoimidazolecarboxamide formyltransferase/IMP cyclohydrolase [Bacteroidota bacterium]